MRGGPLTEPRHAAGFFAGPQPVGSPGLVEAAVEISLDPTPSAVA